MKKKLALIIASPFIATGVILLLIFLCTLSITTIKCIDEDNVVFKEITIVNSVYNKTVNASNLIGYNFIKFEEGIEGNTFEIPNYGARTVEAYYQTDYLDMPVIKITTENRAGIYSKENYTTATVSVFNCDDEYKMMEVGAGIRLRGNSTMQAPKKPYRIKFNSKANMLGLNDGAKCKNWVLLAEWFDYSMSRNYINFLIGSHLNYYSSDYSFVELYMNGDYQGVYLLCEQQQINKNRINIEEYDPAISDELDTGYLLENDYYYYPSEDYVIENSINGVVYDYTHWIVKGDATNDNQLQYIQTYMQSVYDALFNNKSQEEIENLIDVSSAVEMTIQQAINADSDVNSSFYVYKDKGGKLNFGAPWDADMAFGNLEHGKATEGLRLNHLLAKLMEYDWFVSLVKTRWQELAATIENDVLSQLKMIAEKYEKEFERNYLVNHQLGSKNFPSQAEEVASFKNQKDASEYLIAWLIARFNWLNICFA